MDTSKIVGEKIKSLRESQSISIEQLAERSGLAVEQIERKRFNVSQPAIKNYVTSITLSGKLFFSMNYLYLPVPQRPPFTIEINPHLHHRKSAQCKAFGIILQINLIHGGIGTLV